MGKTRIAVVAAACGLLVATGMAQTKTATSLLATVDHLVYATPDLKASIDALEKRLGVRAAPGGQHPGRGTRNALIALSPTSYIEIIGPDPEQPKPDQPRQFGIDTLAEARLVTWAAKSNDLDRTVTRAAGYAVKLGEVLPGSRRRPMACCSTGGIPTLGSSLPTASSPSSSIGDPLLIPLRRLRQEPRSSILLENIPTPNVSSRCSLGLDLVSTSRRARRRP